MGVTGSDPAPRFPDSTAPAHPSPCPPLLSVHSPVTCVQSKAELVQDGRLFSIAIVIPVLAASTSVRLCLSLLRWATLSTSSLLPSFCASERQLKVRIITTVCVFTNAMLPSCVSLPYIPIQISFTVHAITLPGGLSVNPACQQDVQPRDARGLILSASNWPTKRPASARETEAWNGRCCQPSWPSPWCKPLIFILVTSLHFAPNPKIWNFILFDHKRKTAFSLLPTSVKFGFPTQCRRFYVSAYLLRPRAWHCASHIPVAPGPAAVDGAKGPVQRLANTKPNAFWVVITGPLSLLTWSLSGWQNKVDRSTVEVPCHALCFIWSEWILAFAVT